MTEAVTAGLAERHRRIPLALPGMAIGLFGGSFNPPHEGHLAIAEAALRHLRLDRLWWMVTPGNPLKTPDPAATHDGRLELSERLAQHPRIVVTGLEAGLGSRYTADTIDRLRARFPATNFVWIMGADSLRDFHRWQRWRDIAAQVPIAVFDRPGATRAALSSVAARALGIARIDQEEAPLLARMRPPAWVFIHGRRYPQSSTGLRQVR